MENRKNGDTPPPGARRDPKPTFEVGQRIVCVDASPNRLTPNRRPLVAGKIYVVRAIDLGSSWEWPWWGIHLEGIQIFCPGTAAREWALHPRRFRPVTRRPTDITIFERLLTAPVTNSPGGVNRSGAGALHSVKHGQNSSPQACA
jgi:hypothetical protein